MRFSLNTLLFIVFLFAAYFPVAAAFEPWQVARQDSRFPGFSHLVSLSDVCEGDSIELVSSKIKTLNLVEPDSDTRVKLEQIAVMAGTSFDNATDFYTYKSQGFDGMLMFCDGILVNHNFPNVNDPIGGAVRAGVPVPSIWFRLGILPAYAIISSILLAAWLWGRKLVGKSPDNKTMNRSGEATVFEN